MLPFAAAGGPVDPLAILLLALLLDALLGDPPALWRAIPHPVALIGKLIAFLERKLNRPRRSDTDRMLRGALMTAGITLGAVAVGIAVTELRRRWIWGWAVEAVLAWTLIAQRSLFDHVRAVGRALTRDGLAGGRRAVAKIVGRDPETLDEGGVARAAVESCAENFADGVVAPVFWYVLFGFPGMLAYKAVNTLDSMIGHRSERYRAFGMTAARLDDAANLVPARLAALLLVVAAIFAPGGKPVAAWRIMWRDHGHHSSPNSGWPEAAMAGALGLALAGPRRYEGRLVEDRWIGDGRARAQPTDIRRALFVFAIACLINAGLVSAVIRLQQ